jgi:hypothetical protein
MRTRATALAIVAFCLTVATGTSSSGTNVGSLWDVDQIQVEQVMVGDPLGLEGEKWRPLFSGPGSELEAFRLAAVAQVSEHLRVGGIRVVGQSDNVILVSIYGGKALARACPDNVFLVEITVWKAQDRRDLRAVLSTADDSGLASALSRAILQVLDENLSMRTRYRDSVKGQ